MKILLLTSTFAPVIGGAETYVLNLARGLGAMGHTVNVVTDRAPAQPDCEIPFLGVIVRRFHGYRERLGVDGKIFWEEMQFALLPELAAVLGEFVPDVVLSNSLDMCVPAKLVSLHIGCPWTATFHEQAPERDPLGAAKLQFCYRTLEPDAIIAGSQFYLTRAHTFGFANRAHLIYHGIDTSQFVYQESASEIRTHYAIPADNQLLVAAGRFKPRKGFAFLIKALHRLVRSGERISLIIAGSTNSASLLHRVELESLVQEQDLSSNVVFDDMVSHESMPRLLSAADIVVQPSLEEGLGLAIAEAMSCGRPVIASRIPGIIEIATEEGIAVLTEPASVDALFVAISQLLRDPSRRRSMGELARNHIVKNFSVSRMVAETQELFEDVIARGARHARR